MPNEIIYNYNDIMKDIFFINEGIIDIYYKTKDHSEYTYSLYKNDHFAGKFNNIINKFLFF